MVLLLLEADQPDDTEARRQLVEPLPDVGVPPDQELRERPAVISVGLAVAAGVGTNGQAAFGADFGRPILKTVRTR